MLSFSKYLNESCNCWKNYKRKPGTKPCAPGSCIKEEATHQEAFDLLEQTAKAIDSGEYDYEGQMARTQLQTILRNSKDLIDMLSDEDNMPEWVQSKITLAQDYITCVRDYLQSKEELGEERGLWDNIHAKQKRIKNGSGERMRKPGSKGAPTDAAIKASQNEHVEIEEGLQQTLRKVVPGYAKREIDRKMDAGKFGKTDADKDANFYRYKKIQDKLKKEEVEAQFDLIESVVNELGLINNIDPEVLWEQFEQLSDEELLEYAVDAKGHKSSTGGLTQKGRDAYNAKGANLQAPVTTPPSKLKKGSKAANRRKSFCARMGGMEGPMKKPNGEPTRKALALRKWNC